MRIHHLWMVTTQGLPKVRRPNAAGALSCTRRSVAMRPTIEELEEALDILKKADAVVPP